MAGIPGLEPGYTESESVVLPLNYIPKGNAYITPDFKKINKNLKNPNTKKHRPYERCFYYANLRELELIS